MAKKDRPEPDFRIARHTIDLLAMLQEKTRGNVTMEEQRLVDNALTELRFRFVQAMESKEKKAAAPIETKEAEPKEAAPKEAAPTEAEPKKEDQAGA